jgi:hypothetical protein
LSAGAFATATLGAPPPRSVGTLDATYSLRISGMGVRTAHRRTPLYADLDRAFAKNGLWAVSLLGKDYVGGPTCAAAKLCSDVQPGIRIGPGADLTFRGLNAIAVKESALRRKFILSGSMKVTGSGAIGLVEFDLWRCKGGLPPTAPCEHQADGTGIAPPRPIAVKAGQTITFTVVVSLTLQHR